jgi:hypothetical protein
MLSQPIATATGRALSCSSHQKEAKMPTLMLPERGTRAGP